MTTDALAEIQTKEMAAVMGPYVGVAIFLLVLWLVVALYKMPAASDDDKRLNFLATFGRLLKKPHYVWGVVAQFFYVGAQICVWSFTIRYVMQEIGLDEDGAATWYLAALILFTGSRFVFTWLMNRISAQQLLKFSGLAAMVLTAFVILGSGYVGALALVGISACMSLMFPTIFGLASVGLGDDRKIGGSGLIMAILGGALLTLLMGQVSDLTGNIKLAYVVPLLCFGVIVFYAGLKSIPQSVER